MIELGVLKRVTLAELGRFDSQRADFTDIVRQSLFQCFSLKPCACMPPPPTLILPQLMKSIAFLKSIIQQNALFPMVLLYN